MATNQINNLIFVVDDDVFFNNLFEFSIHNQTKLKVVSFKNPNECLLQLKNGTEPEIIFLDYNFNGYDEAQMNGLEILRKIKLHYPNLNVVMISANSSQQILINSSKEGALGYFVKSNNSMNGIVNFLRNYYYQRKYFI
jgi:DNA-binding NarL/FixJ family response regulator